MKRKLRPALSAALLLAVSACGDAGGVAAPPPPPELPAGGPPYDPPLPGKGALELPFSIDELRAVRDRYLPKGRLALPATIPTRVVRKSPGRGCQPVPGIGYLPEGAFR